MDTQILNALGKKIRNLYFNGGISERAIEIMYAKNKKEADEFSLFGYTQKELTAMKNTTHNLLLKEKIQLRLKEMEEQSKKSNSQNKENLAKLADFMDTACGIGLRRTIKVLHKLARIRKDASMELVACLMDIEFANLSAKKDYKTRAAKYCRKQYILDYIPSLLESAGWKYGYNYSSEKNAAYLIYVYLPGDVQLTWHTNSYEITDLYPFIYDEWDGQACMTLTKLVRFVEENYGNLLCPMRQFMDMAAAAA